MSWTRRERFRKLLAAEETTVSLGTGERLRVCLCYPNSYSLGMSNLGFQSLYHLLNALPGVRCERAFLPEAEEKGPVISLESETPLGDFDVAAFSLSFDLDAVNLPRMLYLSGLPVMSAERTGNPLILAGGILPTFNPEPLAEIVDAFVIGEGEEVIAPLTAALAEIARAKQKPEALATLLEIPGVYLPSYYSAGYDEAGNFSEIKAQSPAPEKIIRQYAKDLDAWPCHSRVLTPQTEFGNLFLLEISRGCGRGCSFCVAGRCYRPLRQRSLAELIAQAEAGLKFRETIGLVGAAVSDYPEIEALSRGIRRAGGKVSFASLRADSLTPGILEAFIAGGGRTLTLAPEAGSERLRRMIHKNLREEQILAAAKMAAQAGLKALRLYFMIGLPTETEEDILAIADLAHKVRAQGLAHITAGVCAFVPKPHTAFEREGLLPQKQIRRRMELLKSALAGEKGMELNCERPSRSFLQGLISRGDRRLGRVLARLAERGEGKLSDWREALARENLRGEAYAELPWPGKRALPWNHICS
jgi:radical SAM superfamily enzyme YgiQ (UPF0313 family)